MLKKTLALLLAALMVCSLAACGKSSSQEEGTQSTDNVSVQEQTEAADTASTSEPADTTSAIGTVANTLAEDEDTLIATYADKFEQKTYTDSESGLSITYNVYLPEGYDASASYPMVVFIGDSSCAGSDATVSLTQGRGGLVWATEEWQSVNPTIVAVPTYPETILDDHGSYTTTEYVELTKRYIDYMSGEYAVDTNRIYGTGQSMGCMTTLILASEYPDLYAACMFVDGQWDISTLTGLENQTFVYFAAEDDTNAWNGAPSGSFGGLGGSDNSGEKPSGSFGGPGGNGDSSGMSGGPSGGTDSSSYHMASFDYAYNCVVVMEWLFQQSK